MGVMGVPVSILSNRCQGAAENKIRFVEKTIIAN